MSDNKLLIISTPNLFKPIPDDNNRDVAKIIEYNLTIKELK